MSTMTIRTVVDLNTSAADAWRLFGEGFGEWAAWAPGIEESTLEGPLAQGVIRVNRAPSLGTVRQALVRYEPEGRALAYDMIEGLPPFLTGLRNDWVIVATGEGTSRLEGDAVFTLRDEAEPKRPQLQAKMGAVLDSFAGAFRDAVEA